MYTVSKGPSKIMAKARRGISQNLERLDNLRDPKKTISPDDDGEISAPKPFFQPVNGKKSQFRSHQEAISPHHEELIKFIYDSWTSVCQESQVESSDHPERKTQKVVYYQAKEPNNELKDFIPFDLESWWGKRLFNTITNSIP